MDEKKELLRKLPKIDESMRLLCDRGVNAPLLLVKEAVQQVVEDWRQKVLDGRLEELSTEDILAEMVSRIAKRNSPHLTRVINGTGVVLHTNLGRSILASSMAEQMQEVAMHYSNLEMDLDTGERGSRYSHIEALLCTITGAEAALVVNNNAAAVYLILDSMAKGMEVVVSRGELVEIGGSFRIPNIMETSGCHLVEVGATNKTHYEDYREAITEKTGALLKVHTSNYKIIGFTEEVSLKELHRLGEEKNSPVIYDLGSGLLVNLEPFGIVGEPTVAECVPYADVLSFSGDKLLGGPQAGIIVGKKEYIQRMKKNHLLRALRIDKLTLTALESTLRHYLDVESVHQKVPTLQMISISKEELQQRGETLLGALKPTEKAEFKVVEVASQIGGGSLPGVELPSYAVAIISPCFSASDLQRRCRESATPLIARVSHEEVLVDMRTIQKEEIPLVAEIINAIFE